MDMSPPQAPPAATRSRYQEASAAFDRIVGQQAWLASEQADLPALPDDVADNSLDTYLLAVDAYWDAQPTNAAAGTSRRVATTRRIADAARDLAVIAHEDGHLDDAEFALARAVTMPAGAPLPAHIEVREILVGESVYAGTLLVQDERSPERILSFSTERGWESFPQLADAHAALERRARRELVFTPDLRGLARPDVAAIGADPFIHSRTIAGDPFASMVDRLVGLQHDKLRQAWFEFTLAEEGEARRDALAYARFDILRLDHVLDVANMLATRHALLLEAFNAERLTHVPAAVAADWREAEDEYRSVQSSLSAEETSARLSTPQDLPSYAADALRDRLRGLGITENPAAIDIRINRSADVAARLESLQALFEGPSAASISLVDLAYQNIAAFEPVVLSASTKAGVPLPALNDAAIRRLVRELDLSSRYQTYIDTSFRTGNEATMRRDHAVTLQRAHMRLLAAEARLSYYLDDAPRSFRDDRSERGYRWLSAVLDSPAAQNRARVENHEVVVHQMTYLGTPLRDVLSIGVRQPQSVASIVLYTPEAPDGVTFREFADKAEAARRFFYHPAFREYLLDRLPADYARVLPNGSARAFTGDHLANWVLGSGSSSAYTPTEAPFEESEVSDDFLAAAYEVDVRLGLRNVRTFTRSAEQANWSWLVERLGNAGSRKMVADAVMGVITAPGHAAQAAWRVYDSVKSGDNAQAFVDFADFYNVSVSAALPAYSLGTRAAAHAIVGARFRAGRQLVGTGASVQPTVVFESRFIARGVRRTGQADREGILTIEGKTYIEHDGQLYQVALDRDYATWRLTRAHGTAGVHGPAIQRSTNGTWTYHRVGLRGGSGRGHGGAGSPERLPDLYDEYQAAIERAFPDPMERDMVTASMRSARTRPGAPNPVSTPQISTNQRILWNRALLEGRWNHATRTARTVPRTDAPLDLTSSANVLREVPRAQAPTDLWYYGKLPFKDSALKRQRSNTGYESNKAEIDVQYIEPEAYGVRVTTVPPTAPIEQIRDAMGAPELTRKSTFSVRIDPNGLYEPMSSSWRPWYWLEDTAGTAHAGLLSYTRGPANVFYVRPNAGGPLKLGWGQFRVVKGLPPQATP